VVAHPIGLLALTPALVLDEPVQPLACIYVMLLERQHIQVVLKSQVPLLVVAVLWMERPKHSIVSSGLELGYLVRSAGHGCRRRSCHGSCEARHVDRGGLTVGARYSLFRC
jgi:hypothetical protein